MGKTVLTPEFIAFMSALYLFKSLGGLADIGNEIWWFTVPALSAQAISLAIKIAQMSVGPTTWKKLEEHANMVLFVSNILELMALHQLGLMAFGDSFWMRFFFNYLFIGIFGVTCVIVIWSVVKGGK